MQIINWTVASDPPWPNRARRRRWAARLGLLAAAITAAVAIAACGGGSSSGGVAHLTSSSTEAKSAITSTEKPNPLAFAQCMRKHGLPGFPDPTSSGQLQLPSGLTTGSPAFQKAAKVCGYLIGGETAPKPITQTPQMQAAALKLARCMRANGVPNFPDGPISQSSGIDENSLAFQRGSQKCMKGLSGSGRVPSSAGSQVPDTSGG